MSGARLPQGGRIDRNAPVRFRFAGKPMSGFKGDTLASALLANGVDVTARSFKYHRPRGIMGAGIEEPATYVELEGEEASANQPATTVLLKEGLRANPLNCWPSVDFDMGAVNQLFFAVHSGIVLLQDVQMARLASVRAGDPARCRAGITSTRTAANGAL